MDIVGTYFLYLVISTGLTIVVGTGMARSGRAFLFDVFGGNDTLARAVSRLLVLGFYLLSLGFVVLTMQISGDITSARAGLELLSVKIGEVLLVLGALHLLSLAALARIRRIAQARPVQPGRPAVSSLRQPPRRAPRWPQSEAPDPGPGGTQAEADPASHAPLAGTVLQ